jgi:hypothetical protein
MNGNRKYHHGDISVAPSSTTTDAPNHVKPTRDKSKEDLPFPLVYFGFILSFLIWNWKFLALEFPSYEEHFVQGKLLPEISTSLLPIFSFCVVCPVLFVWRFFIKQTLMSRIAENWAGLPRHSVKFEKFCEQGWLAVHYTIATSVGYLVLREKPWWPPFLLKSANFAISAPQLEREQDQKDARLWVLYSLQLGFYTLELVTLVFSKHRRSDAVMYFFHHVYTLFLMAGSWISYNHRIGTLVLFLHDIGDIFLPIGKCYTYAEEHIRRTQTKSQYEMHKAIGMGFFVLFVIGFAIPRLILFGGLIYQGFFEFHWYKCCGMSMQDLSVCGKCAMGNIYQTSLLSVLGLLYPMHVYWFYLIVKMAIRLVLAPGKYEDVRSDDEYEDNGAGDNNKKD